MTMMIDLTIDKGGPIKKNDKHLLILSVVLKYLRCRVYFFVTGNYAYVFHLKLFR